MLINYAEYRINDQKILLLAPSGDWHMLNNSEYEILKNGDINHATELYKKLATKGLILDVSNEEEIRNRISKRYSYVFEGVHHFIFGVSRRCNCSCKYCYVMATDSKDSGLDMDEKTARAAVDFAFQAPAKTLTFEFQGGEPLLNFKAIKYIVEYTQEKNTKEKRDICFYVATNLLDMDEEKLRFCIDHKLHLGISLDGPKFLHDNTRKRIDGGEGNYDKVVYWLDRLHGNQRKAFRTNLTITKESLPYWKEIIDTYRKLGFERIALRNLIFMGSSKKDWAKVGYTAEEFFEYWKKSLEYIFELNLKGENLRDITTQYLLERIYTGSTDYSCDVRPCGAVLKMIAIDNKGDIYFCDAARSDPKAVIGNIRDNTYQEIREKHLLKFASEFLPHAKECVTCPWLGLCGSCASSNFGQFGSTHAISTENNSFCKLNKLKLEYLFSLIAKDSLYTKVIESWAKRVPKNGN